MFDFTKMECINYNAAQFLIDKHLLDFKVIKDPYYNKILQHFAKYGKTNFRLFPNGRISIDGSLHKLHNFLATGDADNYDCFSYNKVYKIIRFFEDELHLDSSNLHLHNLEFGVNLDLNFPTSTVLNNIKYYNGASLLDIPYENGGRQLICKRDEHYTKYYDKAIESKIDGNILRIERAIKKMRCEFTGPIYLSDLLDKSFWELCFKKLIKMVDNTIFLDDFNPKRLEKAERRVLEHCIDTSIWNNCSRQTRSLNKKNLNTLINLKGTLKIKEKLIYYINEQEQRMLNN